MSSLTFNQMATQIKAGDNAARSAALATTLYAGGMLMRDSSGKVLPLSSSVGIFDGVLHMGKKDASESDRIVYPIRRGAIRLPLSGVAIADINRPVFATTDNLADATLVYVAGAKLIGHVLALDYDQLGAVANQAWVFFDANLFGVELIHRDPVSAPLTTIAGTVRVPFYKVPTAKRGLLFEVNWTQAVKPNYATSATLNLNKISGAVRTNLISGINVNNTGALDTPALATITGGQALLAAGDILELEVVTVGAQTTAGLLSVFTNVREYAQL